MQNGHENMSIHMSECCVRVLLCNTGCNAVSCWCIRMVMYQSASLKIQSHAILNKQSIHLQKFKKKTSYLLCAVGKSNVLTPLWLHLL